MPSTARAEAHGPAWPTDRAHRRGNWALIREAIEAHPDKIALTSIHQPWDLLPALGLRAPHATRSTVTPPPGSLSPCFKLSYAQLDAASHLVASHLHAQGIGPGSRVMVCLENRAEWALVWWATMRIGGVFVPINTQSIQRSEDLRHVSAMCVHPLCPLTTSASLAVPRHQ